MTFHEVRDATSAQMSLECLIGRQIERLDISAIPQWIFHFGDQVVLHVEPLWRVIEQGRIAFTSMDHGQRFGLPTLLDVEDALIRCLRAKRIRAASFDTVTGDLRLEFDGDVGLEALVMSAGYESWTLWKPDGSTLIAKGGGRVAYFAERVG